MSWPKPHFAQLDDVRHLYVERGDVIQKEAHTFRIEQSISPSASDTFRIAVLGIDVQIGFCHPDGSLFVPGAQEDAQRTIDWIYRNIGHISSLYFSLDTHFIHQIFHPAWWVDAKGNHPAPMTVIQSEDIESGIWRAIQAPEASLAYCKQLESQGRYVLTIWPYHTLLGGLSHALLPAVMEAAMFHSMVRQSKMTCIAKGMHPQTENYSVFSPEVTQIEDEMLGEFNQELFDELMEYDRIYVLGQASSHCVLFTLRDWLNRIPSERPELLERIWIVEDAMSPVPAPPLEPLPDYLNFPALAQEALQEFKAAGMKVVKTSDAIFEDKKEGVSLAT